MKKRVAIVLLMALTILPGCMQNECEATVKEQKVQIGNLQDQIGILQDQASDLESALDTEKTRNQDLQELIDQQQKEEQESETAKAKLEISFFPNPVICKDGSCCWEIAIKETNGVGIEIEQMIFIYRNEVYSNMKSFSKSNIEEIFGLENAYFPAYGQTSSSFGFSSRSTEDHIIVVIKGEDDNENSLEIVSDKLYFEGNERYSIH